MQPDQVVQALSSSLSFSATQSEMAIEQAEKHSAERVAAAQREARSAKLATENQLPTPAVAKAVAARYVAG